MRRVRGFTLIELLIVVAIIAILAAIAVPNFLEAQVRAKSSQQKNNMRTIATALESYRVDHSRYPSYYTLWPSKNGWTEYWTGGPPLSTPVAYLTSWLSVSTDIFTPDNDLYDQLVFIGRDWPIYERAVTGDGQYVGNWTLYDQYRNYGCTTETAWFLTGRGPDKDLEHWTKSDDELRQIIPVYDSSNGTISDGDMVRLG